MSRLGSGSSTPAKKKLRAGPSHTTTYPPSGHHRAAGSTGVVKSPARVTEGAKERTQAPAKNDALSMCASVSELSSGGAGVGGIDRETGGTEHGSPSLSLSIGNSRGKRNTVQLRRNQFNVRANTQKPAPGVVYLGHIPNGFSEPQMLRFFSQFGEVVGVELRRSRKTGQSKGYGYIAFELPEIAEVVAETMNNYMMFNRTLVCQVVAQRLVPPRLFRNSGKKFRRLSTRVRAVQQHNKPEHAMPSLRQVKRRLEKEKRVARQLKQLGLEDIAPPSICTALNNIGQEANMSNGGRETVSARNDGQPETLSTSTHICKRERKRNSKTAPKEKGNEAPSSVLVSSI